jgi:hypothetical protein
VVSHQVEIRKGPSLKRNGELLVPPANRQGSPTMATFVPGTASQRADAWIVAVARLAMHH